MLASLRKPSGMPNWRDSSCSQQPNIIHLAKIVCLLPTVLMPTLDVHKYLTSLLTSNFYPIPPAWSARRVEIPSLGYGYRPFLVRSKICKVLMKNARLERLGHGDIETMKLTFMMSRIRMIWVGWKSANEQSKGIEPVMQCRNKQSFCDVQGFSTRSDVFYIKVSRQKKVFATPPHKKSSTFIYKSCL